jgi:hypothetical protein
MNGIVALLCGSSLFMGAATTHILAQGWFQLERTLARGSSQMFDRASTQLDKPCSHWKIRPDVDLFTSGVASKMTTFI